MRNDSAGTTIIVPVSEVVVIDVVVVGGGKQQRGSGSKMTLCRRADKVAIDVTPHVCRTTYVHEQQ